MTPAQVEGLVRATLAHALTQLAVHFPAEVEELGLTVPEALEHALNLAEEAISLAPDLPDGHTALGRLLLCHDHPEAFDDAIEVLDHALQLNPEHDPAEIASAVALRARGERNEAMARVERVIRRGNGLAQPLAMRALLLMDSGRFGEARRDLERAVRIAPASGMLRLDLARAAAAEGDAEEALAQRQRGRELLGSAFDAASGALDSIDG